MSRTGRRGSSGVEPRRKEARVAVGGGVVVIVVAVAAASCGRREEEIRLARRRRGDGAALRSTHTTSSIGNKRGSGFAIGILVELRWRGGEALLVVGDILGIGGAGDGAVQQTSDDAAPDQNAEAKGTEDGAYGNEDGPLRGTRAVHIRSVVGGRDTGRRVCRHNRLVCKGRQTREDIASGIGGAGDPGGGDALFRCGDGARVGDDGGCRVGARRLRSRGGGIVCRSCLRSTGLGIPPTATILRKTRGREERQGGEGGQEKRALQRMA